MALPYVDLPASRRQPAAADPPDGVGWTGESAGRPATGPGRQRSLRYQEPAGGAGKGSRRRSRSNRRKAVLLSAAPWPFPASLPSSGVDAPCWAG